MNTHNQNVTNTVAARGPSWMETVRTGVAALNLILLIILMAIMWRVMSAGASPAYWPDRRPVPAYVDIGHDFYGRGAIRIVAGAGLMTGTGPDTFDPTGPVTRAQVAVVLVRCLHGADFQPEPIPVPTEGHPYGHWGVPWIAQAVADGMMESLAIVAPDTVPTRTDLAMLVVRCGTPAR